MHQGDRSELPELLRDTELVFRQSRLTLKIAFSLAQQPSAEAASWAHFPY